MTSQRVLVPSITWYNDRRATLMQQAFCQQRSFRIKLFVHESGSARTD